MQLTFLGMTTAQQELTRTVLDDLPGVTCQSFDTLDDLLQAPGVDFVLAIWTTGQSSAAFAPVLACGATLVLLADTYAAGEVAGLVRQGVYDCLTWAELPRLTQIVAECQRADGLPVIHSTAAFDALPVSVAIIHENRFIYVNPVACAWLGYTRQEMTGMHYLEVVHPDLRAVVAERGRSRMRGEQVIARYELPALRKDGTLVWADFNIALAQYCGETVRLVTVLDITSRKQTESTLRATAHMLETATENSPVVVVATDQSGCITMIEGQIKMVADMDRLVGRSIYDLLDDGNGTIAHIDRVLAGQVYDGRIEAQERVWDIHLAPIMDDRDRVTGLIGVGTDVTETARTRLELQHSEQRFDAAFHAMPVATLLVAQATGVVLDANPQAAALTGYAIDGLIGEPLQDIAVFDGDCSLLWSQPGRDCPDDEQRDVRLRTADGSIRHVRVFREHVMIGHTTALLLMLLDNTPQQEMVFALRESEERLLAVFNGFEDVILIFDLDSGVILQANNTAQPVMGYAPEALRGTAFTRLFLPDDSGTPPFTMTTIRERLQVGPAAFFNTRIPRVDGTVFPADVSLSVIDWDRQQVGLASLRDISERIRTRHTLMQVEAQLASIVEHAPIILFMIDLDGTFMLSTGRALAALGLQPGQVVGRAVSEVYAGHPEIVDDVQRALGGEHITSEYTIGEYTLEVHYTPVHDEWGQMTHVSGVALDITERLLAQAAETRAAHLQEELTREREVITLKEGFISMVSHEFRNPLTSIMMSKDILRRSYDRLDDSRRQLHIDRIGFQARFMTELLDDVLLVMRANMGYLVVEPSLFDLTELVQEVVQQIGLTDTRVHAFQWEQADNLNPVYMDQRLIRYVLVNLLNNAQKYTPEGGAISLATIRADGLLHIRVADTGIGIPPEDCDTVFDIFKRARNTDGIKGTGLGLTMVKFAVDAHQGDITLESAVNEGTTFHIRLPATLPPGMDT